MKISKPEVYLVGVTLIDWEELQRYFSDVGTTDFRLSGLNDQHDLTETAGRLCYRSWEPGLNKNVTRVRKDQEKYIENILKSGHGSVLEHVNYSFIFRGVSRVLTHELVRHRAGSAFSQESLRYVRLDELRFWFPDWLSTEHAMFQKQCREYIEQAENFQRYMADYFKLDDPKLSFAEKKAKTSFMRRFAPEGLSTDLIWTANARTVRHVITERTSPHAEEEIRMVFGKVAEKVIEESPYLFQDFEKLEDGTWIPRYKKV